MSVEPVSRDAEWQRSVGRTIDELVTAEIRFPGRRSSGLVKGLYDAARTEADDPLSLGAALGLREAVDEGDTVIVATGAGKGRVNLPNGETDGPLGAVGVARALAMGLGARPVIAVEDHCLEPTVAALRAGGLNDLPYDELLERRNAATAVTYPKDREAGVEAADEFVAAYDPAAIVAVEKGSPNREGVYHSSAGTSMDVGRAKIAPLFDRAADEGIVTVGIGDNGNEIGYGRIEEAVRELQPYGDGCQCPCGGGAAARVATDHLVVANTSNWGAYGLEAMLAILADAPEVMHEPGDEDRMLEHAVIAGANDGVFDRPVMGVDGTNAATQRGVVAVLHNLVENGLSDPYDRGF